MKKIAAIDIGSNAIRMLICYVIQSENHHIFQKNSYIRLPLRLGEDSFRDGIISNKKIKTLSDALISFKYITDGADEQAHEDWEVNLADGIKEFKKIMEVFEGT